MTEKLQKLVAMFEMFDAADRTDLLLGYAGQFKDVPPEIATRPFAKSHQIPQCESDAYVWAMKQPDGTLRLYFAVENPSGISAKALAAILDKTLSGLSRLGDRHGQHRHRRKNLPAEHLDGQGHGPDVDGPGRGGPCQIRPQFVISAHPYDTPPRRRRLAPGVDRARPSRAVAVPARPTADRAPIRGFTAKDSAAERKAEETFRAIPKPDNNREYMRTITDAPHHAGSPGSQKVADYILSKESPGASTRRSNRSRR